MTSHAQDEEPTHSSSYKQSHPHIHEVKYKDSKGKVKIYVYRYGTVKKGNNSLNKVKNR